MKVTLFWERHQAVADGVGTPDPQPQKSSKLVFLT